MTPNEIENTFKAIEVKLGDVHDAVNGNGSEGLKSKSNRALRALYGDKDDQIKGLVHDMAELEKYMIRQRTVNQVLVWLLSFVGLGGVTAVVTIAARLVKP